MMLLRLSLCVGASALVPASRSPVSGSRVTSSTALKVNYLSEVEDADSKKKWWDEEEVGKTDSLPSDPRMHSGVGESDRNAGPTNYEGFIDAEGFDGGDGQVGCVGDDDNKMPEFNAGPHKGVGGKASTFRELEER